MAATRRSFRIRCYPNPAQIRMLNQWYGASRWLWNWALESRTKAYKRRKESVSGMDISLRLTNLKKLPSFSWLAKPPSTCLTQTLRDQDTAFANFFRRVKAGETPGYPRFRSRYDHAVSLRFQGVSKPKWLRGVVSLIKIGTLKLAENIPAISCPDTVTLKREADGRYYVTFSAVVEIALLPVVASVIGVDLGLTHLATLSSGEKISNPRHLAAKLRYLRQQQRCLSRRQKGSQRREKQRLRVARAHSAVANQRNYAMHALTTRLIREHQIIAIEDLSVRNMIKNPRLARHISDAGWGEFRRQIEYKAKWYGRIVVVVDRWFPSSKTCSKCAHKLDELRLDIRQWTCPKCGTTHDRDINAAQNLLVAAMHQLAPRESGDLRADGEAVSSPREARTGQVN
ncbi:MAG: RNA-guided endonuclease InsQ/TnpB family protein [Sulfobacillus sp.]